MGAGFRLVADGGTENTGEGTAREGSARYVFRVRFRLEPETPDVTVEPETFETVLSREADQPGTDGWLFFRDNLWRGEAGDHTHLRDLTEEALDVPVDSVSFRELQTDEVYLADLKAAIAADLGLFNADSATAALSNYLGSSIRVVDPENGDS